MGIEYGVARISTKKQNLERQERNILAEYPDAKMIKETYTGTKLEGRKEFENLLKIVKAEDTLIFDSVSRMSRNAEEGFNLYEKLFYKGVNLVFLKEHHIDTSVYRKALETKLINIEINTDSETMNEFTSSLFEIINKLIMNLVKEQIKRAFEEAEKEVKRLHVRTSEGLLTAKLSGKQVGQIKGSKLITKKSKEAKEIILKYSKDFDGTLADKECIILSGVTRKSYYKYKKELKLEII
ncbi:MAG: recombinase family protein [Clostridia bacterium]|nr:recombinase family protein [Clostridia bacterium]